MKSKNNTLQHLGLIALAFAGLSTHPAQATPLYWDTNGTAADSDASTGTWGTSNFWNSDSTGGAGGSFTAVTGSGDDLFFNANSAGSTGTVTVSGTQSANTITLQTNDVVPLSGGTIALTSGATNQTATAWNIGSAVSLAGSSQLWTIAGAGNINLNGLTTVNASNVTLTKAGAGAGVLSLAGGLTFNSTSGTTFATSGTTAADTSIGTITFSSGTSAMTVSGSAFTLAGNITNSSTTNAQIINNAMAFTAQRTITTTNAAAGITLGGLLSGTGGSLAILGPGVVTISNANNTFDGGITLGTTAANSVKVLATASGALGTGTIFIVGNASSAVLQLSGGITLSNAISFSGRTSTTTPGIQNISGNNTLNGLIDLQSGGAPHQIQSDAGLLTLGTAGVTAITTTAGGNRTLTLQGAGNGEVVGNIINGSGASPVVTLAKTGAGTWTLSGTNTYAGATTLSAGTLALTGSSTTSGVTINGGTNSTLLITAAGAAGSGAITTATAATTPIIQLHINGGGTIAMANSFGGNTAVTTTIDVGNNGSGSNGVIQLNGAAGNYGNSTLNITGSNGYSLFIAGLNNNAGSAGTTVLNPTSANLSLGTYSSTTNSAKLLQLDGTSSGNSVTGVISNGTNVVSLTKANTSTWTLSGANTYTGATNVNAGTLAVNGNQIAATGAVTVSNSGTRLIGTGTLGANTTTISSGAIHSSGGAVANLDKVGLQTFDRTGIDTSDLTYGAGSIFEWDLNANSNSLGDRGTGYDGVNVTGTLAVDSTSIFRVVLGSGVTSAPFWQTTQTWANIFGGGFALSGSGFNNSLLEIVNASGGAYDLNTLNPGYQFTVSGTSLTWSAVPEPSSALIGMLVTAGLLRRRRNN